ncbi:hypothetical protein LOTGIDRAFT_228663 [Lottia gigantea]|uniref:Ig-like domain-containing protein n=1 Tax=Lottia gigantea TaxID=225164 RepID=V4AKA7_LOTGI|nr:hypothetical protein LOTGIDRAFT_228663 [Lottia gigantea]ESO93981.1 hypothetical protein LOTGIDRAFT_228663 [Lottia gigantea]
MGRTNKIIILIIVNVLKCFSISLEATGNAVQGEEYTLRCIESSSKVIWYKKKNTIGWSQDTFSNPSNNTGCLFHNNSSTNFYKFKECGVKHELTINSVDFKRDNGVDWSCQRYEGGGKVATFTVLVNVPLKSVEMRSIDLDEDTLTAHEQRQIHIECVTESAHSNIIVVLQVCNSRCFNYTTTSDKQPSTIFRTSLNATHLLDKATLQCIAESASGENRVTSSMVVLYVLHHPRIRIRKEEGRLYCIAEARPRNVTFLPWKHTLDNILVREIEGYYINTTVYSLNITNSQNNGGNYTCTVNNGIPDPYTKQYYQMAYYNLELKIHPNLYNVERNNNSLVGQNGSFSLKYLEDQTVNVSWYNNDTDLQTSSRITIREEPAEISHPYNNTIKLSGIKTILTITSINITDQGNYTCQVCNQCGCSSKTFQLDFNEDKRMEADEITDMDTTVMEILIGLAALFTCIIVIVIFIVYKRRTKSKGPILPVITENELYISSDLVCDQPHSSNTVPVQKPVEMEIIENDLYVSSDLVFDDNKKQDFPIYGQVNKVTCKNKTHDNKSSIG